MEAIIKENFSMDKSMGKDNTNLKMGAYMRAHLSMINLMVRVFWKRHKGSIKGGFKKENFTVKGYLNGKTDLHMKEVMKITVSMDSENILILKVKVSMDNGKRGLETGRE
jgi:hypothetical protein